jgi:hypothetical protein
VCVSSGDFGVQCIQTLFPKRPVAAEPRVDLGERLGTQPIDPPLRFLAHLDKSGLSQHAQVPGDSGASDRQQICQLAHGGRSVSQRLEHGPPVFVRQRLQYSVHVANVPSLVRNRLGTYGIALSYGEIPGAGDRNQAGTTS